MQIPCLSLLVECVRLHRWHSTTQRPRFIHPQLFSREPTNSLALVTPCFSRDTRTSLSSVTHDTTVRLSFRSHRNLPPQLGMDIALKHKNHRTYVALHPPHKSHPACQTHPISCTTPADAPYPDRRHTSTNWRGKARCTSQMHLHPVGSGHTSSRTWKGAVTPSSTPSTTRRGTRVCRERSAHRSKRGKKMNVTCARVSLPSLTRRRCGCVRNCVMGGCRVGTGARKDTD